jgi:hypothetical protein
VPPVLGCCRLRSGRECSQSTGGPATRADGLVPSGPGPGGYPGCWLGALVLACHCRSLGRAVGVRPRVRAAASGFPGASSLWGRRARSARTETSGCPTGPLAGALDLRGVVTAGPAPVVACQVVGCTRATVAARGSPGIPSLRGRRAQARSAGFCPSRNLEMSTRATRRRLGSQGRFYCGPGASRRVPSGGAHPGHCRRAWIAGGSDTGGSSDIHCQSRSPVSRASARTSRVGQRARSGQYRGPSSSWRARSAHTGPCPVTLICRWGTYWTRARPHQPADGSSAAPTPDSERTGAGPAAADGRDSDQTPDLSRSPSQPGEAVHVA